ncbi:MAG TPA: helix-turn-helix domain-containing protein [Gemmatimonadales bacterium]
MQNALAVVREPAPAASLLEPVRRRVLELLREPGSAAEVARTLGVPRQRIGYHVRELERQGLLRKVGTRRRGTAGERLLQATARHYLISPELIGALGADPAAVRDRLSSTYLVAVAAESIRTVAALREGAERQGKKLPTLTLDVDVCFESPASQHAFAEELARCLAGLAGRFHRPDAPDGRTFRFAVLGHPKPASTP